MTAALILAIIVGGFLSLRAIRHWRNDVITTNMSLTNMAAHQLARDTEEYLLELPLLYDEQDSITIPAPRDTLDHHLKMLATTVFASTPGIKGGFWVLQEKEFMGYSNPWSPPPTPLYGPPPRSHGIILEQVTETIQAGESIVRLHQFDSISVSKPVFPLATVPVQLDGHLVAVAWTRIHIERDLPATILSRYLNVTAFIAMFAFLLALITTLHQRREIRSLNANLKLIEQNPSHRLTWRRGMFGSIRHAINKVVDSLETEFDRSRSLEEKLHQQDKMAALGNLLAGVAHEVKTPLAILKTRVQIWQRDLKQFTADTGQPAPLTEESMQIVLNEINRLSNLLAKLLYFSRPIPHDQMHPLAADDLIRHTVLFIKPRLLQKRIDLDLELSVPGAEIQGEPDALYQVFLNILTNSLDLLGDGEMIVVVTSIDADGNNLVVDLEDSGTGIPEVEREQVFTPFYTTRHGGSGLGLSIAYEIVHAHKGTIEFIDPEILAGAHCRITLPLSSSGMVES